MGVELGFTVALMVIVGIALFLFVMRHAKKIVIACVILLVALGIRCGKLGVEMHQLSQAREMLTNLETHKDADIKNVGNDGTTVDLPESDEARFMYYYDTGKKGYGLLDEEYDGTPGIIEYFEDQ